LEGALMSHVLTLIGAGLVGRDGAEARAGAILRELGATVSNTDWLAPEFACDIHFESAPPARVEAAMRAGLGVVDLDLAVQPTAGRRKQLLVADMESTIITRELLDELAALAGLGAPVAAITRRSMRGEIDFAQSLRERVAMLAGQPVGLLERVAALIELTAGARCLVRTMRANGAWTVLVSGGFDSFAAIASAQCDFDEFRANRLEIAQGKLAGTVGEPILDRAGKQAILTGLAADRGLSLAGVAAIGDGANDIGMLQVAGLGVAFRAKPAVITATRYRLDYADLTGLLYLQGYRSEEFRE
jgi:phosphoserine phosphatase